MMSLFIVYYTEKVQDQNPKLPKTVYEIHDGLDLMIKGHPVSEDLFLGSNLPAMPYAPMGMSLLRNIRLLGMVTEGDDLVQRATDCFWIWDWKSSKKLPDPKKGGAWSDHRLQASAYAKAWALQTKPLPNRPVIIKMAMSTFPRWNTKFVICEHEEPWDITLHADLSLC
jgi:hypothetical protein